MTNFLRPSCTKVVKWARQALYNVAMYRLHKLLIPFIIALVVFELWLLATSPPISADSNSANRLPDNIERELVSTLDQLQPGESTRFLIRLAPLPTIRSADLPLDPVARRASIIESRRSQAERSQAELLNLLADLQHVQAVTQFQPLWIVNSIAVEGNREAILTLANHRTVVEIETDQVIQQVEPIARQTDDQPPETNYGLDQIRATETWHALNVTGEGVTVAIMDTGVDWEHPILRSSYRGLQPDGSVEHAGHWFQAAIPTETVPYDAEGHGTHVAGTTVGAQNIGVAPGAKWIAVSIANENGFILESTVHAAFEWLLAPNGDPALAPDVVNGSWGGDGADRTFEEDINLLKMAGIIPVFAAGNLGPSPNTIDSPSSLEGVISVGATDSDGKVAWFSSRGPSPLTTENKPHVVAPGAAVISSLPDGTYGKLSGTSMATPHTTGAIALLLSANPALTPDEVFNLLIEHSFPLSTTVPNPVSGYGLLDSAALVGSQLAGITGRLEGLATAGSQALDSHVITVTTTTDESFPIKTDPDGRFALDLLPGTYQLSGEAFGYEPYQSGQIEIVAAGSVTVNPQLVAKPTGQISGQVTTPGTGTGVPVEIIDTARNQLVATADPNGNYTFSLPEGEYTLRYKALGYQFIEEGVTITAGANINFSPSLATAPTLLFLDGEAWRYKGESAEWAEALDAQQISYDRFEIGDPINNIPTLTDLEPYEVVIWSSPRFSPGYIFAADVISDYMGIGGNILLSGRRIVDLDAHPFGPDSEYYLERKIKIASSDPITPSQSITGVHLTRFEGFNFTIGQEKESTNQHLMNTLRVKDSSQTEPILSISGDLALDSETVAVQAGHCDDYKAILYGFNLDEVDGGDNRSALIEHGLDYFAQPPVPHEVNWLSDQIDDFAVQGETNSYQLKVQNNSELYTDTLAISLSTGIWENELITDTLTLGPCSSGLIQVDITVPTDAGEDLSQILEVTARSTNNGDVTDSVTIALKTASDLLLVDDHRWYNQQDKYKEALDALGIEYDVWQTGTETGRGSPPVDLLKRYKYVIWYTAYDWFEPISAAESNNLEAYLEDGGRLFISSQDYMFYHPYDPLTSHYFGIEHYVESVTPTYGYNSDLLQTSDQISEVIPLVYDEYRNNSDSLIHRPGTTPFLWHNKGIGGVAKRGEFDGNEWHAMLWSIPFESLVTETRPIAMSSVLGWLSDAGESTFVVDYPYGVETDIRTYTLTVRNSPFGITNPVYITNTLPPELEIMTGTLSAGASYDPTGRTLTWSGELPPGTEQTIQYQARGNGTGKIENKVSIEEGRHGIRFSREALIWNDTPNLSASMISMETNAPQPDVSFVTYTLSLVNEGAVAAEGVSMTATFSDGLSYLTNTLQSTVEPPPTYAFNWLIWEGDVAAGESITMTLSFTATQVFRSDYLLANLRMTDQTGQTWFTYDQARFKAYESFAPIMGRRGGQ